MYLKSDRELFRRRRRPGLGCLFLVLVLVAGAVYYAYDSLVDLARPLVASETPTPSPTATPSAGYYAAEAETALLNGAMGDAIVAYQQALDLEPNRTLYYLELARLLIFYGKPERGLEMARQALLRQPENARAWALLGLAYDWLRLPDRAVSLCEKAVQLDPTLPEAYAYLAEAYIDNGQWFAANEAIATALELDDNNVDVLRGQAYVLENQGNYYGAIKGYEQALLIQGKLVHLEMAIGRNAAALNNLLRARKAYEDAVAIDPGYAIARDQLGWTHLLLGDYDSAKQDLLKALELDPLLPDAYGHMGTLYFHQRDYEDAVDMFRPAIEYGEARSRRRTVLFVITLEDMAGIADTPKGPEVATLEFIHPTGFEVPLRGEFQGEGGQPVKGKIRLDVMEGRYAFSINGLLPAPSGKAYIGWFINLFTPEGRLVHTSPFFPAPDGRVEFSDVTGAVQGPPIEYYYTYGLCYYLLEQCDQAMPYIQIALRIDPDDENARKTLELCQGG